jgi:hypothetical protein
MRTLNEFLVGSIIFIVVDKISKLVSSSIVNKGEVTVKKAMLRIEILTLFVALFIAVHFV